MIAADTSTWIAFFQGDGGEDTELLDRALQDRQVLMVPVVLTEVLSDPKLPSEVSQALSELPLIEVKPGYWQRAGELRAKVLAKRRKARLGDAFAGGIEQLVYCDGQVRPFDPDFRVDVIRPILPQEIQDVVFRPRLNVADILAVNRLFGFGHEQQVREVLRPD